MCVADPADNPRIGQRPLERAILSQEGISEFTEVHLQRLYSPWIEAAQCLLTPHDMERGPLVCARLREQERTAREVEGRVSPFLGDGGARLLPLETPAHHEVDHGEELTLELKDDALADPS